MRRILSMAAILLCVCTSVWGYDLKVWLSNPTMVADGKTVTYLTFYQTDSEELYWNFEIHVKLPQGIHIAKRQEGRKTVNDATLNPIRFEGLPHTLGVNMPDATTLKTICVNMSSRDTYYRDDVDGNVIPELFTVGLIADPEMQNGKYEIEMTVAKFVRTDVTGYTLESPAKAVMTVTGGQGAEGELQYTLSEAGYGTLILPYDAEVPDGLGAYACRRVENSRAVLEQQASIVANTPVILHGTPGTYTFTGEGIAAEGPHTDGLLTCVYEATEISDGYVLQQQNGVVGFYVVDPNVPRVVPANRCYLCMPSGIKYIGFWEDQEVGIADMDGVTGTDVIVYDLTGRRVEKKLTGIIIKNGKKVIQ